MARDFFQRAKDNDNNKQKREGVDLESIAQRSTAQHGNFIVLEHLWRYIVICSTILDTQP